MLTSERVNLWEQAVLNAHTAEAIQPGIKMTISAELVLEMDKYLDKLNEDLVNKMVIVGVGCDAETADLCDYCGNPMTGGIANTAYGTFHIYCHGPAAREHPRW